MKTDNDLIPQNEVNGNAPSNDREHVVEMSALCLIVLVVLMLVHSLILFLIISHKKKQ